MIEKTATKLDQAELALADMKDHLDTLQGAIDIAVQDLQDWQALIFPKEHKPGLDGPADEMDLNQIALEGLKAAPDSVPQNRENEAMVDQAKQDEMTSMVTGSVTVTMQDIVDRIAARPGIEVMRQPRMYHTGEDGKTRPGFLMGDA